MRYKNNQELWEDKVNYESVLSYYEKRNILGKETIVGCFMETAKKNPDKIALHGIEGEITYRDLAELIRRYAGALVANGVCHGDHVILHISNSIMYVAALLGTMFAGAAPIPLLQEHRQSEIVAIGRTIEASVMIVKQNTLISDWEQMVIGAARKIPSMRLIISDIPIQKIENVENITEEKILKSKPLKEIKCRYNEVGMFLLSGGTTGIPKIIPKIHEAYVCNIKLCCKRSNITDETVFLTPLSVSHDFGLAQPGLLGVLFAGGMVVLPETPFYEESFELIERYRVNTVTIVPALASMWLEALEFSDEDLSSWKLIIIGAAKLERKLVVSLSERLGVLFQNGYGLGEGITCFTSLSDDIEVSIYSQGTPVSEYDEIRIVDDDGNSVPVGEEGELLEKGPYTFGGYYHNDELNAEVFTEDGFFRTGDKARIDKKGNITILGRVQEQINRAGENVIPSELEEYIQQYPGIKGVCVFGVPDEVLGEKTVACIITNEEIQRKDICEYMRLKGISSYKFPDIVYKTNKFPYKNIGKVDKKSLKMEFLGGDVNE